MDDGSCGPPPRNPTDELDVSFMREPSARSSSVLIHLQHEVERWECLRDRATALPEFRNKAAVMQGGGGTWSTDEVFIGFLLDRLEKDLDSREEGNLTSDQMPCIPQAGIMKESRHPKDNSTRRGSKSRQQNQILRANIEVENLLKEGDMNSKACSVDSCEGGCRHGSFSERPGNEESHDGVPTTATFWSGSSSNRETATVATAFTSDELISKEGEDCPLLHPGDQALKTLEDDQAHSRLSPDPGNKNESVSPATSSDDLLAGTGGEMTTPKEKSSPEDKDCDSNKKAGQQEDKVQIKRRRGRPRIEIDEVEMKAMMFNKRLREIQHQDLPRMFSCRSCGEQFKESEDLRIHTITAHLPISIPDNSGNTIKENGEIQFTHIEIDLRLYQQVSEVDIRELSIELRHCPECNEYVENMKTHLEIHMMKNYICEECGKGFATNKELQTHSVHHKIDRTGVMPFSCNFCDKTFRTAQSLSIHRPLHNKARNFICQQCGKTFKANVRLQKHLGTHAKNKRYSCSFCGRGFAQKCNMTRHQRTHTGEKPYECRHCHQCFNHNVSLTKHLKKEHSVQVVDRIKKTVKEIDNFPTGRMPSKRVNTK